MKQKLCGILMAIAVLSIAFSGIRDANAYFTSYSEAKGTITLKLGSKTTIDEKLDGNKKILTITNKADSEQSVYVRARAFAGSTTGVDYTTGDKWTLPQSDGWCYYTLPLAPGETSKELICSITFPTDPKEGQEMNVAVVYESTPALEASYTLADWSRTAES